MKGMPFNFRGGGGGVFGGQISYWTANNNNNNNNKRKRSEVGIVVVEPCSVLDHRQSPSPSPPTSSLAGTGALSCDSAGVAALSDHHHHQPKWATEGEKKEEWASELQPIPPSIGLSAAAAGFDEWEAVLSDTIPAATAAASSPTHEQTFLRWIMGDIDDDPKQLQQPQASTELMGIVDSGFSCSIDSSFALPPLPSATTNSLPIFYQEPIDQKPIFNPGPPFNPPPPAPPQNPDFLLPLPPASDAGHLLSFHPNPRRHHSISPITHQHHHHQTIVDHLLKASEFIDAGNPFSAREILARLNQLLPLSPLGLKPLLRSAFIFKDVLNVLLTSNQPSVPATPADVVLRLSSYKAFSEVSPLIHFANFTCTQTLLEEVGAFDRIHIVDFDIGVGGHWSSFMQELAHRRPGAVPFLKITAFVSVDAFHPLELHLTRENLSHFAAELSMPFEFSLIAAESFNPNELLAVSTPNEAVAVSLPFGSHYPQPFPALVKLVKQLNPKVVVSVDRGCDRSDLPFAHHLLHTLQACTVLLDSIDAAGANADVANKIERFIVQPRAERAVLGRHRTAGKLSPWRAMFGSAGFVPWQFSNFTETQADCLLKRVQVRGFHVEKRQGSLFLYWQRGELGSVSSWKC